MRMRLADWLADWLAPRMRLPHLAFAIAAGLIAICPGPVGAEQNDPFGPGFPPWPAPPNNGSWCREVKQCDRHHNCSYKEVCPPQSFASSYRWQVMDRWSPERLQQYDDAWCRSYGPPGSRDYQQCRENNYYTRLSAPNRWTR